MFELGTSKRQNASNSDRRLTSLRQAPLGYRLAKSATVLPNEAELSQGRWWKNVGILSDTVALEYCAIGRSKAKF
jgi:hypothetical protein